MTPPVDTSHARLAVAYKRLRYAVEIALILVLSDSPVDREEGRKVLRNALVDSDLNARMRPHEVASIHRAVTEGADDAPAE